MQMNVNELLITFKLKIVLKISVRFTSFSRCVASQPNTLKVVKF